MGSAYGMMLGLGGLTEMFNPIHACYHQSCSECPEETEIKPVISICRFSEPCVFILSS